MKLLQTIVLLLLLTGCAPKKSKIDTSSWKTVNLDAYSGGVNEKNAIKALLKTDTSAQTIIELDKIQYKITQFNAITDTLKGKYHLEIDKKANNQTIKIVRL